MRMEDCCVTKRKNMCITMPVWTLRLAHLGKEAPEGSQTAKQAPALDDDL